MPQDTAKIAPQLSAPESTGEDSGPVRPWLNPPARGFYPKNHDLKGFRAFARQFSYGAMIKAVEIMHDPRSPSLVAMRAIEFLTGHAHGKPGSRISIGLDRGDPGQDPDPSAHGASPQDHDRTRFEAILAGAADKAHASLAYDPSKDRYGVGPISARGHQAMPGGEVLPPLAVPVPVHLRQYNGEGPQLTKDELAASALGAALGAAVGHAKAAALEESAQDAQDYGEST